MNVRPIVAKVFEDTINETPMNSELKRAIRNHPKIKGVIQNVANQILTADAHRRSKGKKAFKQATIEGSARDFAQMFIKGIAEEIRKREQSDIERIAEETKLQKAKDLDATINGKPSGDYVDMVKDGLKIGDTTVEQVN